MGGHVAISSLELHPGVYQGALIECGVIDGVHIVDLIYAYRAAAEFFSGVTILDVPDRPDYGRRVNELVFPALGEPGAYTRAGRRFDSVVKYLFGGDLPLRLPGLRHRYIANMFSPVSQTEPLGRSGSTLGIRYRIDPGLGIPEDELNAKIRRIAPVPGARSRDVEPVYAELTGRITVPVLAVHETGDARVPFSLQQSYRQRTIAAGTSHLLVQRAVRWPSHCGVPEDVMEHALEDLVRWIERDVTPAGDDVFSADLSSLGLRWTSIRHPEDPVSSR
jgi:pimeloyl-ACP methyl ester carboxylesterase